jgi:hypothetical protein
VRNLVSGIKGGTYRVFRLRVLENRMLRVFGPKRVEVIGK